MEVKRYCVVRRWKDNPTTEQILENFSTVQEAHVFAGQQKKSKDYIIEVMV